MKILFVTPHFPPALGGVEHYVFNIALGLSQIDNIEVVVVTSSPDYKKQLISYTQAIKVYYLPVMVRVSNTPINPLWYFSLKKIIKEEKPDIINSHQPVMFLGDIAAIVAGKIPFVLTYHAGTMKKGKFPIDIIIYLYETLILPYTAKKATKIICASNIVKNTILKRYASKSTVIHPGVDISVYKPNSKIKREENLVLFIAGRRNMHKMKGLYYLIEAVKMLPDIKLCIVGEKENFTDEKIISLGVKRGEDLAAEMQKASLVVLPSIAKLEGFPMVLIEAMACQTPVIGTNLGGIPEVVNDGIDGFIVPANDSKALALAITKIMANKELATRMGQYGEAKIRAHLTWDTRVALTKEVFEACLK